ncbi:MAG: hypothetical protein ABSG41_13540, partial [Bryobacteraceae bacterium]
DWLHSVIANGRPLLALTVVSKLSYATDDGHLPIQREKCGLNHGRAADKTHKPECGFSPGT